MTKHRIRLAKPCSDSLTIMTELVMPNDTNPLGNLMGGNLLKWMDICSSIAASKHAGSQVVTAAVDNVSFQRAIRLGDVVTIEAKVTRTFTTSMEIHMVVYCQSLGNEVRYKSNEAFYTFVALDNGGRPKETPETLSETDEEQRLFDGALRRRQLRLILAGRMKPQDANELKAIFFDEIVKG